MKLFMKGFILTLILAACTTGMTPSSENTRPEAGTTEVTGPHHVTIQKDKTTKSWQMLVDGKPFFAQGASYYVSQKSFYGMQARFGANSARCFGLFQGAGPMLDQFADAGLMIHAGLGFKSMRSGYYNENEKKAIVEQEDNILDLVRKFKDHPAILCWCIGNEFEIGQASKPLTAQWESIERLTEEIHEIDPHHPVTLAIVDGYQQNKIKALTEICTDLDFISVNGYVSNGGEFRLIRQLDEIGWEKPFMTSELGPAGWWLGENLGEGRYLPWGAVVDLTSTEKENEYLRCMQMCKEDKRCIGIMTFLWGWQNGQYDSIKEWYGLLDRQGYTYGAVDVMQAFWTGQAPEYPAPRIESRDDVTMDGKTASEGIQVQPGSSHSAVVKAGNPSDVQLRYHWRIVAEQSSNADNSFHDGIEGLIADDGSPTVHFMAPTKPGGYRLYIHIYDDIHKKAAYFGIPFLVEGQAEEMQDLNWRP